MNDVERNHFETQLAELELLMSMYPNKGELQFDDVSELANLRAALDSGDTRIHVGGVGFTLQLSIIQVLVDGRLVWSYLLVLDTQLCFHGVACSLLSACPVLCSKVM